MTTTKDEFPPSRLYKMALATGRGSSHVMERIYLGALVEAIYSAYHPASLERLASFIEVRRVRSYLRYSTRPYNPSNTDTAP